MTEKKNKTNQKPLSKGQRTHLRRTKQVARKEANLTTTQTGTPQPGMVSKKQDQS